MSRYMQIAEHPRNLTQGHVTEIRNCRGSGYAADVVLDGRANKGDVIDEDVVYKRRFDLRAQRCEVRSTSIVPSDLHGEERSRKTRTREINRGEGANLALDSGPIDSDTADLIQRSRIDHAAELTSLPKEL
ncbi:hypothetical protein HO133_007207 [Letharia lupina]|uniref:Uncharacterized protein n=1 Tax=Letharia lupina TaxID=560253 RepID=A0A8H6KYD0_9LECA|nr:uncharacterized protein HO133_007207 [Letharia lupina]KAF6229093.1 hypothetical protein HO133_007207 [Letharia lupina]